MNRLFTRSSINFLPVRCAPPNIMRLCLRSFQSMLVLTVLAFPVSQALAQERPSQRENIRMSVVVVNPSETKTQTIPVKVYLPLEVTPDAIVNSAGLTLEYDTASSVYYLQKEDLQLAPKASHTFQVEIKDVWIIPEERIVSLRDQTKSVISRLEGTEFYETAKRLGEVIYSSLDTVIKTQNDDTVSSRSHIGIYRNNLSIIEQIKEDLEDLEKRVPSSGAPPVPDVLENQVKTDTPTKTTTWMIILIIMVFVAILGGVFFFTWQTQAHFTKDFISSARKTAFPENEPPPSETPDDKTEQK